MRQLAAAVLALAAVACVALLLADALWPLPLAGLEPPPARLVTAADGTELRLFLPADGQVRLPVRLHEVAPVMQRTLVASEDRWFRYHPGVNPLAVLRAAWSNLRAGEVVSGASTVTTQVVRLLQPRPRTVRAKVTEALRALQLEWHYSKDELLEAYLNLTPYGRNLQGVGAAARYYFGKTPAQLSLGEAALLTALPRSPTRYDPTRDPAAAEVARTRVLSQLQGRGLISAAQVADALAQPLPSRAVGTPFLAPHFAEMAVAAAPAGVSRVATTIDAQLQRAVEVRARGSAAALQRQGIDNIAVVVIEIDGRALRAMVGSVDFFDGSRAGAINAATALRSPGSALKPFLYAQAIDSGALAPGGWVLDVPTDFSGYVAENYDGTYRGRVTAADALRHSLNAPAVRLLSEVGLEGFLGSLRTGGLRSLDRPALYYGLPLVLGAGEVRLLDLVNLYATLAAGGQHAEPRLLAGQTHAEGGPRLWSTEAAEMVTRVLAEVERPDLPEAWRLTRDVPAVAWKTGTSYGHRDAWAVGFSRRYAIGVWVGNLDGRAQQGISGATHAGPLLFEMFRIAEADGARLPYRRDLDIDSVEVCADSHQLPGAFCPRRTRIEIIPGRTRLQRCDEHRRIFVDAVSGERLAGDCLGTRPSRPLLLQVLPAELVAWQAAQGRSWTAVPPLSSACGEAIVGQPPDIVSPDPSTPYLLRGDAPLEHQRIALTARVAADVNRLYWYEDGMLVASGAPGTVRFVSPRPGEHTVVVVDDAGRADRVRYRVE